MMNFIQIIGLIILSTLFQYHQVLLYNIMNQTKSVNVYGNIICAAVGFLIVFLTSIFVAKNFYDSKINGLIEEVTVLKDYHYSYWGQSPGAIPSEYTYTLTPYSIDTSQLPSSINSKPLEPILFNYSYKYKQVSFGQGNQGFIRYKDSWKLTPSKNIENSNITTINLGAQKVYGYQYYSTISRRFTIMFNNLLSNAKKILIPFYSMTLHQFYISNQKNVYNNIFKESGLDQDKMNLIYNHELYGWKTPKTFQTWVKLCNRLDRSSLQEYQTLIEVFGLSVSQLQRLIGQKSFLKILTKALNGTIKAKIQDPNGANYIKCKPYCNDEQLLTLQFSQGLLTTDSIFSSINIGKATNEIITIIPNEIQLKSFCTRQGKSCVQDGNAFDFFASQFFSDYSVVNQVFTNKENLKMIEAILNVLDPTGEYLYAQSMVQYMDYLYNNVFTPTSDDTSQPDFKAYNYMFNNYLYFNQTINNFKEILFIQLHARALKNIIDQDPQTFVCQNFYKGSYSKFSSVCQNSLFDLKTLDSIKIYIKAYFFQQRSWFIEKTKMSYEQASKFFKLDKINSLFASQIDKIRTILGVSFGCQKIYCNEEQLIAKEWSGSNQILTKLPKQLFSKSSVSILQWDVNNKFKGIQPQYYKIMKQTIQQQKAKQLLSLQIDATQSILHPFVLFSYKIKAQSGDAQAKKILNYIQKLVIDSYFKGPFVSKSLNQTIVGYKPEGIAQKRDMDIQNGGAPWIENIVSLVEIQYNGDRFNKLNTGIYERQKLRSMLEYNQKAQIGTYYTIYELQQTKVEQFIGSQDKIHGTNILGFHSDIGSQEVLSCYLNFADQTIILNPIVTQYQYNGIIAIKYNVKNLEKSSNIGLSHQNERFAIINPQSFFIIDPITGTTLSFSIKFSVSTKMTYLQYYFPNPISQIKLYDMEVQYNRKDFQDILNIMDEKQNLLMFYIITMSLSVASMICIIVGTIMYRRKLKVKKSLLKDTLISDDDKSSIKI